ncbi:MAG: UMP kinase [Legionella sp.]
MTTTHTQKLKYKRILLKYSGEALMGEQQFGIDPAVLDKIAHEVKELVDLGVELAIVIGGGNLFRGKALSQVGLERVTGDHMGMLATVMNALALRDALKRVTQSAQVMSAIAINSIVDSYNTAKAMERLSNHEVIIFAAGTGNPFFTTDTAACLRAIEIKADIVIKATKVDGVYTDDPVNNPSAQRYDQLSYQDVIRQGLQVMDATAICLCQDHGMPLQVCNMKESDALRKIVYGECIGTIIGA